MTNDITPIGQVMVYGPIPSLEIARALISELQRRAEQMARQAVESVGQPGDLNVECTIMRGE
jgi:hypothetical protein